MYGEKSLYILTDFDDLLLCTLYEFMHPLSINRSAFDH
jgi:hypothetical protein